MTGLTGRRRFKAGISQIVEAAVGKGGNRIIATLGALREWPDSDAQRALETLRLRFGEDYEPYFRKRT